MNTTNLVFTLPIILMVMHIDYSEGCVELIFDDSSSFEKDFNDKKEEASNAKCLQFGLKNNMNTWILYSNNGLGQEDIYFELKDCIKELPEFHNDSLAVLKLPLLGLKKLPDFSLHFKNLTSIDVSFNNIDINTEIENLKRLKKLKDLTIYGYNLSEMQIEDLMKENKVLKINHSKEDYLKNLK